MAMSPDSVRKLCTGSPSTSPPLSTPRIVAHQPYIANAFVTRAASAHAALPHRYLLWSVPSTCSSYSNASTGTVSLPYGSRMQDVRQRQRDVARILALPERLPLGVLGGVEDLAEVARLHRAA